MTKHIPALDGIRGVAILLVLFAHLIPYSADKSFANRVINGAAGIGWTGVSLFFVLSGFLITGILAKSREEPEFFRNFYARRTLRICPLYFLLVTLCVVLLPRWAHIASSRPANDLWMYWCYLSNFHDSFHSGLSDGWIGQLWSLAVEEHFYLLWPAVIYFCSRSSAIRICLVCLLLANVFRVWFVMHGNLLAPYFFTPCRMDDLAIGSLLALLVQSEDRAPDLRAAAIGIAAVTGPLVILLSLWKHASIFNAVMLLTGLPLVGLFFASLLALVILPGNPRLTTLMSTVTLRTFGKYSFGLYMYHPAVASLMTRFALLPSGVRRLDDLFRAAILIVVTFAVSLVSYHLFEMRFLNLKRYFSAVTKHSERGAADSPVPTHAGHPSYESGLETSAS